MPNPAPIMPLTLKRVLMTPTPCSASSAAVTFDVAMSCPSSMHGARSSCLRCMLYFIPITTLRHLISIAHSMTETWPMSKIGATSNRPALTASLELRHHNGECIQNAQKPVHQEPGCPHSTPVARRSTASLQGADQPIGSVGVPSRAKGRSLNRQILGTPRVRR